MDHEFTDVIGERSTEFRLLAGMIF